MAEFTYGLKDNGSFMLDDEQFNKYWANQKKPIEASGVQSPEDGPLVSPSTAQAAARGAQSGGLSGALISGGVSSMLTSGMAAGGPYAIAGGLLLSELEAAQKEKARVEAEKIQNEKDRMANMQNQLNAQSRTVFRA